MIITRLPYHFYMTTNFHTWDKCSRSISHLTQFNILFFIYPYNVVGDRDLLFLLELLRTSLESVAEGQIYWPYFEPQNLLFFCNSIIMRSWPSSIFLTRRWSLGDVSTKFIIHLGWRSPSNLRIICSSPIRPIYSVRPSIYLQEWHASWFCWHGYNFGESFGVHFMIPYSSFVFS